MNTPDPRAKPETQEGGYGAPSPEDELAPMTETGTERPSEDADLDAANAEPQHGDRESFSSQLDQEASGDPEREPNKP